MTALGTKINKHLDTIAKAKASAGGAHISELRSFASIIKTLNDNFTLETTDDGVASLSWFEVFKRLPKHVVMTLDTIANKDILQQIARGDHLGVRLHERTATSRNVRGTANERGGRRGSGIVDSPADADTIAPIIFDDARSMRSLLTAVRSITESNVAEGLPENILKNISDLKTVAGLPAETNILRGILNRIFRGQFQSINLDYFAGLKERQKTIKPLTIIPSTDLNTTIAFNLDYIKSFAPPLDHTQYKNSRARERMRTFFVPYEEIDTRIGVLKTDGTIVGIPVFNNGKINVCKCAPPSISQITMQLFPYGGYTWEVGTTAGLQARVGVLSEKDHAYVLTNKMKLIIDESMRQKGTSIQSVDTAVSVEATDGDIELVDDNDGAVSGIYILKADFDTVVTTYPTEYSTEYTVDYDLIEGTDSQIEAVINDKFKYTSNYAAGCLEKGKDGVGADLFIRYIIRSKKMKAIFRTFSTDNFRDKRNKSLPIIVAGVPRLFYLCMTNNMKYNPEGAISTLTRSDADLFRREITFTPSIDPQIASRGLTRHFSIPVGSFPGLDIDGHKSDNAMEYKLDLSDIGFKDLDI